MPRMLGEVGPARELDEQAWRYANGCTVATTPEMASGLSNLASGELVGSTCAMRPRCRFDLGIRGRAIGLLAPAVVPRPPP